MSAPDHDWTLRPIQPAELKNAVAALVSAEHPGSEQVVRETNAFELYAQASSIVGTAHWGAFRETTMLAACLCFDHPGRTSLIFVPEREAPSAVDPVILELLARQAQDAASRNVHLLQVILRPEQQHTESLLQRAQFTFLADLQYLERPIRTPGPPPVPDLHWRTYGPTTQNDFRETIRQTYAGSLDCPQLAGKRDIHDVIDGHKAAGDFNPDLWFLAVRAESPVAVLLLARNPAQHNAEIVYMGVIPQQRGRNIGRALLHKANSIAQQTRAECLTLAVDAANRHASMIYSDDGFVERAQRRAWIRFVNQDA